ncbi:hypothetical protein [Tissierella sp.]|uniref:hypothetical protein n=1 Tax=Tissierella sp. TaxID=41274 RepID=UPI002864C86B|nr:hypothetical protein [Tissierella sp.]MDR7855834.1 hypothetical protein [Tissierella sp.]
MWTTIYMAIGLENAEIIERKLKEEGFLVKIRYFSLEGEEELYEILAPEFEAEEVQEAMIELGIM